MNRIDNYKLAKKLLRTKAAILALTSLTTIGTYKIIKYQFTSNAPKYIITYETYSTLTNNSELEEKKAEGNENEVIMKVYHPYEYNNSLTQIDYYYFEKDESLKITDYLNLEKKAIKHDIELEKLTNVGKLEEFKEVITVRDIEPYNNDAIFATILSILFSSFAGTMTYGTLNVIIEHNAYPSSLISRINLYNELKEKEKRRTKVLKFNQKERD